MKLLLDTHILLWAAFDTLPPEAMKWVLDESNALYFSTASIWEVVIKNGLGRSDFNVDAGEFYRGLIANGYEEINVEGKHALTVATLPPIHKDPFDRIIIAQSMTEKIAILTSDENVARYDKSVILVK
jgi:PIN domain nuclease of toxin-antitoxin system